jgi:subtilisin family serine protease
MTTKKLKSVAGALALTLPIAASAGSYIVLGTPGAKLDAAVAAAGGTVTKRLQALDAVVAEGDGSFHAAITGKRGVQGVARNLVVQWTPPALRSAELAVGANAASPPTTGDDDFFFDLQWGHTAVRATGAWAGGARGAGARVAVLDGGFDTDHPDLAPNIDLACSADMTGEGLTYGLSNTFSHGTHVAGTIAAADNAFGTIGVAPESTLCLVKVLGDAGSGSFDDVASGIVHAADQGVDVINMSLGAALFKSGSVADGYTARDVADLKNFMARAVAYAHKRGALVVASAGNDAIDGDKDRNLIHLPSDTPHAVSISATAPLGWAADPANAFLDYGASYTNYGRSVISLAAPGGDTAYPGDESCTIAGLTRPCWVFDLVFSTGNNGWYWSAGTSMAAPHAAGVAALIVGKHGKMRPAQLRTMLERGAADLGQPGNDPIYGAGRVDALGSVE